MPRKSYLNGEILYKKYFSLGQAANISKLANFANTEKMWGEHGYKPTRMGVWKAMWRWASLKENKNEAYCIFSKYVYDYGWTWDTDFPWKAGDTVSLEMWHKFMIRKISRAYQYKARVHDRFLTQNGWI